MRRSYTLGRFLGSSCPNQPYVYRKLPLELNMSLFQATATDLLSRVIRSDFHDLRSLGHAVVRSSDG